jgi:hypothetical protein
LSADTVLHEHVLQKEEMSGVQHIDGLTSVVPQKDTDSSFDTGVMVGIMLFGVLEVRKAQIIDRNLLLFGSRKGGIGE